ncbi:MAG TPA: helix-turn-helix domain-containing protein [Rhizomicrobium sp.]|nr:helix-turn-helix domain-containing protein [Rhizomicrobium sp.]
MIDAGATPRCADRQRVHWSAAQCAMSDSENRMSKLINSREAAALLRIKPCTVRNERIRGKLGFVKIGARIYHSEEQLAEYLERQTVDACVTAQTSQSLDKLEATGSAKKPDGMARMTHGVGLGTRTGLDRPAVSALAQQIFKRPVSSLRPGSSNTTKPAVKHDKTKS